MDVDDGGMAIWACPAISPPWSQVNVRPICSGNEAITGVKVVRRSIAVRMSWLQVFVQASHLQGVDNQAGGSLTRFPGQFRLSDHAAVVAAVCRVS